MAMNTAAATGNNRLDRNPRDLPTDLRELNDLDDYEIADGERDPRGVDVVNQRGEEIGEIDKLIVSPSVGRAFFAIIKTGNLFNHKRYAIPMEYLHYEQDRDRMMIGCGSDLLNQAPEFNDGLRGADSYRRVNDYWSSCSTAGTARRAEWAEDYDRAYMERNEPTKTASADEIRVPVTEEEAEIHRERHQAGFITIRKRTETEHKNITVPVTKTHVTVERHAVSGEDASAYNTAEAQQLKDGETLRIPVVEETVEVKKVPRVTEEVVVRTQSETEEVAKDVELTREEVEVDKEGNVQRVSQNRTNDRIQQPPAR
ncbi:MAG: hypothetical protein OHK0029_01040 [Armatimonadaceae bacterium]